MCVCGLKNKNLGKIYIKVEEPNCKFV